MNWEELLRSLVSWATNAGIKLIVALILWLITFKVINKIAGKIENRGVKDRHDKTLMRVLSYAFKICAKTAVIVSLVGYVGIDTSGITALLVSAGAAIGLAMNGALGNLAGGILLIITRPFRIDDFIEAQGVSGTVEEIRITMTKIKTPDNKVVFIPNGPLSSGTIVNYSMKDTRRVDFVFSIGYQNDFNEAKTIVSDILASHELVLDDPATFVRVSKHGESAIEITARAWVKSGDYWTVNFDVIEAVKKAFDENATYALKCLFIA